MAGRSHNVAAQATTLGKRFATIADEMLVALERLDDLLARYPLRGIKGPMGTSQDMLDLLGGDADKLADLEQRVARHLGFERVLTSVGQVYPRSLDFDVVSALVQLVAGPSNLATTIRLMAGHELVTEGFAEGQVGSSAMPHKMNTRSCERVNGLAVVLRGYLSMVGELAGDQWNEGDVSCSVVRRVALPDAFFAADGLFRTFLTVLDEFGAFPAVIQRELDRYLPFLATTKVLMAAVRRGVGREVAHEAIKEAAVGAALDLRQGAAENDVVDRLAAEPRASGCPPPDIEALMADPIEFTGAAVAQTQAVVRRVEQVVAADPDAAAYSPGGILSQRRLQGRLRTVASRAAGTSPNRSLTDHTSRPGPSRRSPTNDAPAHEAERPVAGTGRRDRCVPVAVHRKAACPEPATTSSTAYGRSGKASGGRRASRAPPRGRCRRAPGTPARPARGPRRRRGRSRRGRPGGVRRAPRGGWHGPWTIMAT